ncbi:hypothetical protein CcCBS67573_g10670, partial [Chytriomyces confervae]
MPSLQLSPRAVSWTPNPDGGAWAYSCDWLGNDIASFQIPAADCGSKCGDAIVNNGDGAMCGIMTSSNPGPAPNPPTPGPAPSSGLNVNVVNKCSSTIWPGLTAVDGNTGQPYFGNAQSANPAGFELGPGASRLLKLRTNVAAMRLWARTGCRWNSGKFVCDVGDCGNPNNNYDGSCFRGTGLGANTLFEITITPTGHTYYDLSIVDGYSIPVSVTLSGSPKQVPGAGAFSCGNPACRPNFNSCPPELKKYGPNGAVIACQSISKAINDDATRKAQPALAAAYNNIDTRSHTECSCIVGSCAGGTTAE